MTIGYTTSTKVYATGGITSSTISEQDVQFFIEDSMDEVDRICNTTFWKLIDSGTASAGGTTSLTDSSEAWTVNGHVGHFVWIYGGTGIGQIRKISSNTATILTVGTWGIDPDATSTYRILSTNPAKDPYVSDDFDGTGTNTFYLDFVPLMALEEAESNSVSITTSDIYQYKQSGKLVLQTDAEATIWSSTYPQNISLSYWYGVYPIPRIVERYCTIVAAMRMLSAQIGGTFDDVTSFNLPHMSGSLGEPYTNIREALARLTKERDYILPMLPKYLAITEN